MSDNDDWRSYQKLVLSELQRLNQSVDKVVGKTEQNAREIEVVKVKSSIFGSIAAIGVVMASSLIEYLRKL